MDITSLIENADLTSILKGGTMGYGIVAISIPIFYFISPLNYLIPIRMLELLYLYLLYNGMTFIYLVGKERFFQPKPICPKCNQILKMIDISECPNCNTKLEKNTSLKCPNCGIISFEQRL